jgi:hypothetical protein
VDKENPQKRDDVARAANAETGAQLKLQSSRKTALGYVKLIDLVILLESIGK